MTKLLHLSRLLSRMGMVPAFLPLLLPKVQVIRKGP